MKKRTVAIVGLETIFDGMAKKWRHSETFLNNIKTYIEDHPDEDVLVLDAREYKDFMNPLGEMFRDIQKHGVIDQLIYSGHSGPKKLFVFFRYPEGQPDQRRFITKDTDWSKIEFSAHAEILLMGCQTLGQNGKRVEECIGQWICDATKRPVWGFCSRSAQKKIGNKFYMKSATALECVQPRTIT